LEFEGTTAASSGIQMGQEAIMIDTVQKPNWYHLQHPHFRDGKYGYHATKAHWVHSKHQRLQKAPLSLDLMTDIFIQISKNPNRYNASKLPKILKKPFGLPRKIHRDAWRKFKKE